MLLDSHGARDGAPEAGRKLVLDDYVAETTVFLLFHLFVTNIHYVHLHLKISVCKTTSK